VKDKRLVIAEWLDHSETTSWTDMRDIKTDPLHVFTVGWIVTETDDVLVVAPNYSTGAGGDVEMVVGAMQILKKVLIGVKDLPVGKATARQKRR
jgi:hypothetical protein